jgi:hypothetical protein
MASPAKALVRASIDSRELLVEMRKPSLRHSWSWGREAMMEDRLEKRERVEAVELLRP